MRFFDQKLLEVRRFEKGKISHVSSRVFYLRFTSGDVVKKTSQKKKLQKTPRASSSFASFLFASTPPVRAEAPAEGEEKITSLFTQTPKFTQEEHHDETLIWGKEDR